MWSSRARFHLRTLLGAISVFCALGAVVAYELNWIRQRRAVQKLGHFSLSVHPAPAPSLLRFFGETGVALIVMNLRPEDLHESKRTLSAVGRTEVLRARALFPEAIFKAMAEDGEIGDVPPFE